MKQNIRQGFEESQKQFDDLLASLSGIDCENTMPSQDARDPSLKSLSSSRTSLTKISSVSSNNRSSAGSNKKSSVSFSSADMRPQDRTSYQSRNALSLNNDYRVRKSKSSDFGRSDRRNYQETPRRSGYHSGPDSRSGRKSGYNSGPDNRTGRKSGYNSGPDNRSGRKLDPNAVQESQVGVKPDYTSRSDSRSNKKSGYNSGPDSRSNKKSGYNSGPDSRSNKKSGYNSGPDSRHSSRPNSRAESESTSKTSRSSSSRPQAPSKITYDYSAEPGSRDHPSAEPSRDQPTKLYTSDSISQSSSNNISETDSHPQRRIMSDTQREAGSYSPSSYESLARDQHDARHHFNPYKENLGAWPPHSSPFGPNPGRGDPGGGVVQQASSQEDSASTTSNNYSSPTSPHLTSPPPSENRAGFYKGRVQDKLALPPQTSPEWVTGSNGTGHCGDCETTEQQLRVGAVNIVRENETRLTNALKSVKSQRVASGYRSDSVLGPSSEYKKRNHRSADKISNLHKSTENLKTNYVELASFGPPPQKPSSKSYNGSVKPASTNGSLGNHGNHGNHGNGTQTSEHAYANLPVHYNTAPNSTQNNHVNNEQVKPPRPRLQPSRSFHHARQLLVGQPVRVRTNSLPGVGPPEWAGVGPPDGEYEFVDEFILAGGCPLPNGHTDPVYKLHNSVSSPPDMSGGMWHGPESSVPPPPPPAADIPNRTITDLAPVPPKRSESSRFSSRLKRKKESKSTPSTPSSTPDPKSNPQTNGSFFAKASQMFRKRKKERPLTYAELMRLFAPPPPQGLLRAYHTEGSRTTDNYAYNVKVGMRISPNPQNKESILSVDESKSTVLIANETLFFDYVHGPQSKQIDVCSSMLSDVLPAILHGRSVVVVTFGKNSLGRQYSLIGSRDSTQSLGLVPTAVTWLNKLGDDDRSKCGPNTVHVTSLRLDEQKSLSEFVSPATISKSEDLGKYLDKLTLTLPAREHPNDEALIINMTFSKSKSKKKNKDNFGMLTFIDVGTPIRKNDNSNVLCWQWLQDVTQTTGNKYYETFVQLRHNLMQSKTHIVSVGHITHSPKDYQAIGITLNLATRLYMRHLPAAKRSELQRLKREKEYSSATSTGEESADTVIYRPGMASDGEGPPKSYLPERTKGDGQEKSPQFCSNKRPTPRNYSDTEEVRKPRLPSGYHSDTGRSHVRRGTGYASDSGNYKPSLHSYTRPAAPQQPTSSHQPSRSRQYALTDSEDLRYTSGSARQHKQFASDTENMTGVHFEPPKRRQTSKTAQTAEDIRQKRVQKNQQQLKRYFELLRLKNQREAILQQSKEMRGMSTPDSASEEKTSNKPGWSAENPTKSAPPEKQQETVPESNLESEDKENEEVKLRVRTGSESRGKGDNRRLYTIYDTEDDGAVLDQLLLDENRPRRSKSGYKSDGGLKTSREKTEISREWIQKIKKKRSGPQGKIIDYGPIDANEKPQVREVKPKRVKNSMSEDELLTRANGGNINNRDLRYSDRRLDKRSGYSTDAPSSHSSHSRPKTRSSGYQSDGPSHKHRHRNNRHAENTDKKRAVPEVEELYLDQLYEEVQEIEQLVQHKMQWRGAVQDLDYFDQQIRILERRNSLIEKLRRKQYELLSELKSTKDNLMSTDWKPDLTVDSTMNENSPGYLSALWKETSNLETRVNTCKSKILVETSFM